MIFDAVLGNPPYQEHISDEDTNSSLAKQLFPEFIKQSIDLHPKYLSLITPSRWFTADAQDKSFIKLRQFILKGNYDKRFLKIFHYPNENEIFSNVLIAGGVNYFLYSKNHYGNADFSECINNQHSTFNRPLFEKGLDIIISSNSFISILHKVIQSSDFHSMMEITQGRNAFGITGKDERNISSNKPFDGSYELRCAHEIVNYVDPKYIIKNKEIADSWKIFTSKGNGGAGILSNKKSNAIIGKAFIGKPKSVCTDSLIPIGCFDNEKETVNLQKYLKTKFCRFMIGLLKTSQNISQNVYRFVPLLNFNDSFFDGSVSSIDSYLYKKYNLTDNEISLIEKMVREIY